MNGSTRTTPDRETPIYDAVKYVTKDQIEQTVRRNAAARRFEVSDEHLNVIRSLIEHYRHDCDTRDCGVVQESMRFLEEAYEFRGGRGYLHKLFDALADARGVVAPIHELAGLPDLASEPAGGHGAAP